MKSSTLQPAPPRPILPGVPQPRPAGFFSRLEAFILDLVVLSVLEVGGAAFIQAFLRFFQLTDMVVNLQSAWQNSPYYFAVSALIITIIGIGYYTFCWTLLGFTPGKAVLGLKIVRRNGGKITFGRSLLRFFAYWISALPLFLGFFWVLWEPNRRGWHDKIAGTQVLYFPKNLPR